MSPQNPPQFSIGEKSGEDRATAAILATGDADVVPALSLRYWRPGIPVGGPAAPVFITWLPGAGRFCLIVRYGQYSLHTGIDTSIPRRACGARGRRWTRPRSRPLSSARPCGVSWAAACPWRRPWFSRTWSGTGAWSVSPTGAAFPCYGTWSATPPGWPWPTPALTFANPWSGPPPWLRYPHCWSARPKSLTGAGQRRQLLETGHAGSMSSLPPPGHGYHAERGR